MGKDDDDKDVVVNMTEEHNDNGDNNNSDSDSVQHNLSQVITSRRRKNNNERSCSLFLPLVQQSQSSSLEGDQYLTISICRLLSDMMLNNNKGTKFSFYDINPTCHIRLGTNGQHSTILFI